MINQSDWELLVRLHQYKSISRTARELFISQPGLTKRFAQLEEIFGVQIAVRGAKGLIFTPHGEYLVSYAKRMVSEYDSLLHKLQSQKDMNFGTLHIATSNSLARFLLPQLLGDYKCRHPNIGFHITSDFSFQVSRLVNNRSAQIGFFRGDYNGNYEKLLLQTQRAFAVYSKPFNLSDLPYLPRVDFYADQMSNDKIDTWWYAHFDTAPITAITVKSGTTCREMIRNGLGYGIFLSEDFIAGYDDLYRIPLFTPEGNPITRDDWMIYNKELLELETVSSFVRYVEERVSSNARI